MDPSTNATNEGEGSPPPPPPPPNPNNDTTNQQQLMWQCDNCPLTFATRHEAEDHERSCCVNVAAKSS